MSQPERKLGTWPIFVIAVSAMTPLTVVAGALPLGYGQVQEKGIPVAYMLVAAVLGVFAVGLAAMARHVPNSGAFYAYASIGISRPVGVGTAFVALLAYNAMQIGLYGAFGVATHNALAIFGLEISWIVCALVGWLAVGLLGRLDIDLNARILTVLVCAEVLIVLVFDAVMVGNPYGGTVAFDTLNPALLASAGGVSLLVAAIAGMVGFEAPLVYAAEARDPRRTIARAIGFTLLVAAVLYGGTAWAMSVVAGPDNIVAVAGDHLDDLFFFLPEPYLSGVVLDLGRIFFATSLFAAMLAFHHTVARYAVTVAREGVLPPVLARTRAGVPVAASTAQSALALVVLLIFAAAVWNPTTDLFFFGTVSGGLGVLVLMTIAAVAVVRFFRHGPRGESRWRRSIAPWISTVFLSLVLLVTIAFFGELLDTGNAAKIWSPILLFLLVLVAGIVWGRRLRRERPEVYAVIGTGRPPLAPGETAAQVAAVSGEITRGEAVPAEAAGGGSAPDVAVPGEAVPGEAVPNEAAPGEAVLGGAAPGVAVSADAAEGTGSGETARRGNALRNAAPGEAAPVVPAAATEATADEATTADRMPGRQPGEVGTSPVHAGQEPVHADQKRAGERAVQEHPATAARDTGDDAGTGRAATSAGPAGATVGGGTAEAGAGAGADEASAGAGADVGKGETTRRTPSPRRRSSARQNPRTAASPAATGSGPGTVPGEGSEVENGSSGTGAANAKPRVPQARQAPDDGPAVSGPAAPRARGIRRPAPRPRGPQPTDTTAAPDADVPDDQR